MSDEIAGRVSSLDLVVRGFGYSVRHVITVPESSVARYTTMGSKFTGVKTPLVARCGVNVRSCQSVVVVMQEGTSVTCKQCIRWTGITKQETAHV